jgi:predicted RNA-binding protein Jag
LAKLFTSNNPEFKQKRLKYERKINQREQEEGLTGMKCGYVNVDAVNETNYHNLLSEYHLRPYEEKIITEREFNSKSEKIIQELSAFLKII